ncbi:hypothetical protein [Jannaschia sp. 2305UL9-9]|uniref:hypothetical protein n=1 Tax=Jannaschia sp. 2305UL9-9 TaxID=3121638 RepID=UPI0035271CDA
MTPIKIGAFLVTTLALSACGGGRGGDVTSARTYYATGPIQTACIRADRRAADRQLCGCVQAVANDSLSSRDRSRAVKFFKNPHSAQVTRQSDRPSDEAFWKRYKAFVSRAEQICR